MGPRRVPFLQGGGRLRDRRLLGTDSGRAAGTTRMAQAGFRPSRANRHPAPAAPLPWPSSPSQASANLRPLSQAACSHGSWYRGG